MAGERYDVVGIGNAIVDVIAHVADDFIATNGMAKGAMTLIDADRATELYAAMPPAIETSGGSAANTIAGVAGFGGRVAYVGKVRRDQLGEVFRHDIRAVGALRARDRMHHRPEGLIGRRPDRWREDIAASSKTHP